MDAATLDVDEGDPEYYRLDVEYAMRLTWSGEYVHAAPWSVESQGEENVSHGCTGMSLENAGWFYNMSKPGDVITYVNGSRQPEPWNGYTDWNLSWESGRRAAPSPRRRASAATGVWKTVPSPGHQIGRPKEWPGPWTHSRRVPCLVRTGSPSRT